ncbi:MAG: FAD-binding oxidoreductase, partial [Planctomycetota bacterium]|jgi:hypothetical protein
MDMTRMDKMEVDTENRVMVVEPGVRSGDAWRIFKTKYPDWAPPIPDGAPPAATVLGDAIERGFSLVTGVYGPQADMIMGLEVVLPTGEIFHTGSWALPGAKPFYRWGVGPNPDGLFLGSQGSMGIITKCAIKMIPHPHYKTVVAYKDSVTAAIKTGVHLLAVGLTQEDADALLLKVTMNPAEHINAYFDPPGVNSLLTGVGPADVHNRDPRIIPLVSGGAKVEGNGVLAVARDNVVFCQLVPWQFEYQNNFGLKRTFRRTSFLVTRLLGNLGASSETPLLRRLSSPVEKDESGRWLQGFYLDEPEEWDDPYRFFRW